MIIARKLIIVAMFGVSGVSMAQVPDMLTAFDAGGKALGAGSAFNNTNVDTLSTTYNPAALGFVNQAQAGASMRNFPTTETRVTGPLNDLRLDSTSFSGDLRLSHFGYAAPMKRLKGSVGIAFTTGGWMNDNRRGVNLPGGISQFLDAVKLRTDFINISYGKANEDMSFAWGVGLVIASQSNFNRQNIVFSDPNIPAVSARDSDSTFGIGVQGGVIITPRNRPNSTLSLSVRSPIQMMDDEGVNNLYTRVPARITGGYALRQDGYRGNRDFVVYGAEVSHYLSTRSNDRVKQDAHTTAHIGIEYNYAMGMAMIPIRIGYSVVPAGGDDLGNRNSFTYGLGYRPQDKNWGIELNFGNPTGGGKDMSIYVNYRFKS